MSAYGKPPITVERALRAAGIEWSPANGREGAFTAKRCPLGCSAGLGMQWLGDRFVFNCRDGHAHDEVRDALGIASDADGGRYGPPEPISVGTGDKSNGRRDATADSRAAGGGRRVSRHAELTPAAAIRSERVRWLWPGRVPLRGMVVIAGEKGLGKSILTNAWLPAQVTRGELEGELAGQPADVLVVTAEDDWSSVVKPRLMAHGADLEHVHRLSISDDSGQVTLTLPDDVPLIEQAVEELDAAGHRVVLVVIDPIGAFLAERTDSHKDAHVRRALAPLAALAEHRDLTAAVVGHLTKDESKRLISRVSGAGAFVNAARSVLGFARDPRDPEGERGRERVLVHVASNWGRYAPSLAVRVESRLVEVDDGTCADTGYLAVVGETDVGVDDLQRGQEESGPDCEEEIGHRLAEGPRSSREVKAEVADALKCVRKTVERAAVRMRDRGELVIEKSGFPPTSTWALPNGDSPLGTPRHALRVPNGEARIPEPNPDPSGFIGDTACAVPNCPRCGAPTQIDERGDRRCPNGHSEAEATAEDEALMERLDAAKREEES